MSTTTTNLGLIKPELTDAADITAMNQNWDRLDELSANDFGAVPTTRKINNKALSTDVTLGATDVGAVSATADVLSTTSITDAALAQANGTIKHYVFSGDSYAGGDLPSDGYKYGSATVFKRYGFAAIVLWGAPNVTRMAAKYYSTTNSAWSDWVMEYNTSNKPTASDIGAGVLGGRVMANADASANVENAQVRNILAGTTDLTAGTSSLASGALYFVYE